MWLRQWLASTVGAAPTRQIQTLMASAVSLARFQRSTTLNILNWCWQSSTATTSGKWCHSWYCCTVLMLAICQNGRLNVHYACLTHIFSQSDTSPLVILKYNNLYTPHKIVYRYVTLKRFRTIQITNDPFTYLVYRTVFGILSLKLLGTFHTLPRAFFLSEAI